MRVAVVGAGPAGLVGAIALARAGHEVVVVDRDAGPPGGEPWRRKGVMQFHHPHVFRAMTRNLLRERLPDVLTAVLAAGVEPHRPDGEPVAATILRARRETFERALWRVAHAQPGLALRHGHADRVLRDGHRVTGVVVDGTAVAADLVVEATGRSGRLAADLRPAAEGGDSGAFEAAMAAHPVTAAWTARAEPVTPVRVGLNLFNRYRRQPAQLTGLLCVGDSVCATSPTGGRGVSLAIASALAMADIVTGTPRPAWAPTLDAWCRAHVHPWYRDSVRNDEATVRRWHGRPADLSGPLPPDLVTLAAEADPAIRPDVVHYTAMLATSASLVPVEDRARRVLSGGWRPSPPDGPDRAQLLAAIGTWS
jgi:2-polyprenyl-6-methoxyphenol hydroxylase-like FAD-dependent oxidoreductase